MNEMFPMGFPLATGFYLVLYVVTLAVHVFFMNYVVAGAGYLAVASLFPRKFVTEPARDPIYDTVRDWMPFVLSAAITAAIAPLLFVQILYQKNFYTANLLAFHRWMLILPALILGFYLFYLYKSKLISSWSPVWRLLAGWGAFLCVMFVGYSWTENALLSQQSQEVWSQFYQSDDIIYHNDDLLPRLGMWLFGSTAAFAVLVGWQIRFKQQRGLAPARYETSRRLAAIACGGLALSVMCGAWYHSTTTPVIRDAFASSLARPYLIAASAGLFLQLIAWGVQIAQKELKSAWLWLATAGMLLTILGMTTVREALRLATVDISLLYEEHQSAFEVGGFFVFLAFTLLNAAAIIWSVLLVRRYRADPAS